MPAASIDDVIARLDDIITRSIAANDRRGYFAAVYNRVTLHVRDGIAAGEFDDGARTAQLDVTFANRYLDAYDRYEAGAATTRAWQCTFDAARRDGLLVVQHLLLAMNAHITLDLGIAAAEVAPGPELEGFRGDFDRINDVLGSLTGTVENELVDVAERWKAPVGTALGWAETAAHGAERSAAMLFMEGARTAAWLFAMDLARLDAGSWPAAIAARDEETARISEGVLLTSPAVEVLAHGGSRDVAGNIRVLAQGELAG